MPDEIPRTGAQHETADPVVEAYKRDVDRTILVENLKLSVDERFRRFERFMAGVYALRAAGETMGSGSGVK
jgi:hypothetical protein